MHDTWARLARVTGVLLLCAVVTGVTGGCEKRKLAETPKYATSNDTVVSSTGLRYVDHVVGSGASPVAGKKVTVHYVGSLVDGTIFDSSRERDEALAFTIGVGQVIRGWDEGVASMKVGGRRTLIVPPQLAYGERAVNNQIGPNATLIFDIELLDAEK